MGAGFVARSFSGDREQLVPLIKAGLAYRGFAVIDVISPCVTFNNHEGSTKSYSYTRSHEEEWTALDYIPHQDPIEVEYAEGSSIHIPLADGSHIELEKLRSDFEPRDRMQALSVLSRPDEKIVTGLLFIDEKGGDFHDTLHTPQKPLRDLDVQNLCPDQKALDELNASFR